jgi:bifunctional non-homologous end joining protein LigD
MAKLLMTQHAVESVELEYKDGRSDKVYRLQLIQDRQYQTPGYGWHVVAEFGRRGGTLQTQRWPGVLPCKENEARKLFEEKKSEKLAKGYTITGAAQDLTLRNGVPAPAPGGRKLPMHMLLNEVPDPTPYVKAPANKWWMQQKADGVRAFLIGSGYELAVTAESRTHLPVTVSKPVALAMAAIMRKHKLARLVLDGEMCGDVFYAFDLIEFSNGPVSQDLRVTSYSARWNELHRIAGEREGAIRLIPCWQTPEDKAKAFEVLQSQNFEGVVFKDPKATYQNGRPNSGGCALKYKFTATATVAVVAKAKEDGKRSVEMAVAGGTGSTGPGKVKVGGLWCSRIGTCTIPPNKDVPAQGTLIEVRYLYCVGSLVQAVYIGPRSDKRMPDTYDSLKFKQGEEPEPKVATPPAYDSWKDAADAQIAERPPIGAKLYRCDTCGVHLPLDTSNPRAAKLVRHYAIGNIECPQASGHSAIPANLTVLDDDGNERPVKQPPARLVNPPVTVVAVDENGAHEDTGATQALRDYWSGSITAQVAKPVCLCGHPDLRHRRRGPQGEGYCMSCACEMYEPADTGDMNRLDAPPEAAMNVLLDDPKKPAVDFDKLTLTFDRTAGIFVRIQATGYTVRFGRAGFIDGPCDSVLEGMREVARFFDGIEHTASATARLRAAVPAVKEWLERHARELYGIDLADEAAPTVPVFVGYSQMALAFA